MPEPDLIQVFIRPLNRVGVPYVVTGAVASIIYGEPRLTHDIDLVVELQRADVGKIPEAFPDAEFYCPPPEVLRIEIDRPRRGHFNLIHHESGFKADVYVAGEDELHRWALSRKRRIEFEGESMWVAPPEYVILRKLEYYHEGRSEKHLRDIAGMLEISGDQVDLRQLEQMVTERRLDSEWLEARRYSER
jgi:hypothetical protein